MSFFSFCCFGREIWFLERKIWWWTSSSSLSLLSSFIFFKCFLKKQQQQQIDVDIIFMKKERIPFFLHFNNKERKKWILESFLRLPDFLLLNERIYCHYKFMNLSYNDSGLKLEMKNNKESKKPEKRKEEKFPLVSLDFPSSKKKTKLTNQFSLAVECHSHQTNYYYEKKTKQRNWMICEHLVSQIKPTEKQIFFSFSFTELTEF